MKNLIYLFLGMSLIGCGQYPNPNDLATIDPVHRVEVANKRLESAETTLDYKVKTREISDERRNELIKELSDVMLTKVDPKAIPDTDQWMYGALLRVTGRWKEAEAALATAVKVAKNNDRKVNDTLKLAQAEAKNGKVEDAIKTANTVLDVPDADAAPILPSVLYEVVPAAQGKGHDRELAELLTKAVECHRRVKVDPNSDAGKYFLVASAHHIGLAETKLSELAGSKN